MVKSSSSSCWMTLSIEMSFPPCPWMLGLRTGRKSTLFIISQTLVLARWPALDKSVSTWHSSIQLVQTLWPFRSERSSMEPRAVHEETQASQVEKVRRKRDMPNHLKKGGSCVSGETILNVPLPLSSVKQMQAENREQAIVLVWSLPLASITLYPCTPGKETEMEYLWIGFESHIKMSANHEWDKIVWCENRPTIEK